MSNKYLDSVQLGRLITKIKSLVSTTVANYLPLTGGSITGNLSVSGTITGDITGNVTGDVTGDVTGNADTATNATNDGNGNEIASTYLPLSGGVMTGDINFNKANPALYGKRTTGILGLYAGDNNFDGATLQLFGRSDSTYTGMFYLRASTKSSSSDTGGTNVDLIGRPNGKLTWNGSDVITAAGGTMTGSITTTALPAIKSPSNADQITIAGGSSTGAADGAKLILNGGTRSSNAGEFTAQAGKSGNYTALIGTPAGALTWGGSNVAVMGTLKNGHGILTGHKDSISVNANSYAQGTISFGQTFAAAPMVIVCGGMGHAHIHAACTGISTTGFTYTVSSEGPSFTNERVNWVAIG